MSTTEPSYMLAIGVSEARAEQYIEQAQQLAGLGHVAVACVNSPNNVTIAGSVEKIDALEELRGSEGHFVKRLDTGMAYHTYMLAGSQSYAPLLHDIQGARTADGRPSFFSSLKGALLNPQELQDPAYWAANFSQQVRFSEAIMAMVRNSGVQINHFLGVGPHSALQSSIREILCSVEGLPSVGYNSILTRGKLAHATALETIGYLHCLGYSVDLLAINQIDSNTSIMLVDLPSYPIDHSKGYWLESRISKNLRFRTFARHELLGSLVPDWNPLVAKWRNYLRSDDIPWIQEHKVDKRATCPAAATLIMAIEAKRQVQGNEFSIQACKFRDVFFTKALTVPDTAASYGVETEFHLRAMADDIRAGSTWSAFSLHMLESSNWVECCRVK